MATCVNGYRGPFARHGSLRKMGRVMRAPTLGLLPGLLRPDPRDRF
jgi:hypothetical protein